MVPGKSLIHAVMPSDPSHALVAGSQVMVVPTEVSGHSNGQESLRYYRDVRIMKGMRDYGVLRFLKH
jgi:hypothetical protein